MDVKPPKGPPKHFMGETEDSLHQLWGLAHKT